MAVYLYPDAKENSKDGAFAEEGHYKANVDVMMAIDALELSIEMRPDWKRCQADQVSPTATNSANV